MNNDNPYGTSDKAPLWPYNGGFNYEYKPRVRAKMPPPPTRRPPKAAPDLEFVATFKITESALQTIKDTLGRFPAETGGMLMGDPVTGLISHFVFDEDARTSGVIYYPTVQFLNDAIDKYEPLGIFL
jgi:hypothetical protein